MQRTYRAVLTRGRIRWIDRPPNDDEPTPVRVTLIGEKIREPVRRGEAMADALERLAARGGLTGITDPIEWQRSVRKDRPLPGREP